MFSLHIALHNGTINCKSLFCAGPFVYPETTSDAAYILFSCDEENAGKLFRLCGQHRACVMCLRARVCVLLITNSVTNLLLEPVTSHTAVVLINRLGHCAHAEHCSVVHVCVLVCDVICVFSVVYVCSTLGPHRARFIIIPWCLSLSPRHPRYS